MTGVVGPVSAALALALLAPMGHSFVLGQELLSGSGGVAPGGAGAPAPAGTPAADFSAALDRLVTLVAAAGGAILALVWARVALSWFSNDVTKKIQAKDRARDALVGSLLFVAAISGLLWGLARWVVTGS